MLTSTQRLRLAAQSETSIVHAAAEENTAFNFPFSSCKTQQNQVVKVRSRGNLDGIDVIYLGNGPQERAMCVETKKQNES